MKKIIIALIGIILSLLFCSCGEITDVGNVYKYPIYPPGPEPTTTIVKPTSVEWFIAEGYSDKYNPINILGFPWGKNIKFVKNDIFIDTLTKTPVLSMDVQVESTIPDVSFTDRLDRTSSFRIRLDSIEINEALYSRNDLSISNWFELYLKKFSEQKIYYFNQNDLKVDWMFVVTSEGVISGYLIAMIPTNNGFQTQLLSITFDISYPNKKNLN